MGIDTEPGRVFFTRKGRRIRHLEKHQHIAMTFNYLDCGTGREFDVRELPLAYFGKNHTAIFRGDRAAHRKAISHAIDDGHDFVPAHERYATAPEAGPLSKTKRQKAYESGGKQAILDLCAQHGVTEQGWCDGCEDTTPTIDGCCAVCGMIQSSTPPAAPPPAFLAHFSKNEREEIAGLMQRAADRCDDTLQNPLERQHYSKRDLDALQATRSRALHWKELFERAP